MDLSLVLRCLGKKWTGSIQKVVLGLKSIRFDLSLKSKSPPKKLFEISTWAGATRFLTGILWFKSTSACLTRLWETFCGGDFIALGSALENPDLPFFVSL